FTNTFSIFSSFIPDDDYDTTTLGFNYGLSYPIWKDWRASTNYSWRNEQYSNVSSDGEESLGGINNNSYKSFLTGLKYSTVNNPMFPSNGFEASLNVEQFGGVPD
ncbi:MAG: BamA/TamA family outer membrane protein, partial [Rhodospirillaceae bacterium]|nr:BamA/TamA family outer membrane protein [Rhodospirillaceae bacterium]